MTVPVIHLIDMERFPLTKCGVNTEEKAGALWTIGDDPDIEVTCRNCLKLREGKQMGAPPPAHGGVQEKKEAAGITPRTEALIPYWGRMEKLEHLQGRMKSLITDARFLMSNVLVPEELPHLLEMVDYLDSADARADWALDQVRIKYQEIGAEFDKAEEEPHG